MQVVDVGVGIVCQSPHLYSTNFSGGEVVKGWRVVRTADVDMCRCMVKGNAGGILSHISSTLMQEGCHV